MPRRPGGPGDQGVSNDALMYGLMSSIRTGDQFLDMGLITLVPQIWNMGSTMFAQSQPKVDACVNFVMRMGR